MLKAFEPYLAELDALTIEPATSDLSRLAIHLDGEAGRRLRAVIDLVELRRLGAFFTGEALARRVVDLLADEVTRYVDPACGCGDLLLAASRRLPIEATLEETLAVWNRHLIGRDLVPEFAAAARARITIAAVARGAKPVGIVSRPAALLTNIRSGDGLQLDFAAGDAVLLNPPYGLVVAPDGCGWCAGLTTAAAVFVDAVLDRCAGGTQLVAVLPEVLRGGARYGKLRAAVDRRVTRTAIEAAGRFDALTDVHVFLLAGRARDHPAVVPSATSWVPEGSPCRLGDLCTVSVGPVVANRDPHRGPWRLYLDSRRRGTQDQVRPTAHRRFAGRVFAPPFVVVPRTSRPEERESVGLRATIVRGDAPIAIENHLLVLAPGDRTLRGCRTLVRLVESAAAVTFLNEQLRCRHLTVQAVRDIPR